MTVSNMGSQVITSDPLVARTKASEELGKG